MKNIQIQDKNWKLRYLKNEELNLLEMEKIKN